MRFRLFLNLKTAMLIRYDILWLTSVSGIDRAYAVSFAVLAGRLIL